MQTCNAMQFNYYLLMFRNFFRQLAEGKKMTLKILCFLLILTPELTVLAAPTGQHADASLIKTIMVDQVKSQVRNRRPNTALVNAILESKNGDDQDDGKEAARDVIIDPSSIPHAHGPIFFPTPLYITILAIVGVILFCWCISPFLVFLSLFLCPCCCICQF